MTHNFGSSPYLEIIVARTHVVAPAEHSFHDEGQAHGVVHTKVLRDAVLTVVSGRARAQESDG